MQFEYFSRNGLVLPLSDAKIDVANIEYCYGFGVYESVRVSAGLPRFLSDHLSRVLNSARIIGLDHEWDESRLTSVVHDLIKACGGEAYNLKLLLIGAPQAEDAQLIILPLSPRFPDKRWYKDGVATATYPYERFLPQAKALGMLGSYLAYRKAKQWNCYDALLINQQGALTEGTRTNLFALRGRTLVTPPDTDILAGVTRKYVLQTAEAVGFTIETGSILLAEIEQYDGLLLSSTSSKLLPINKVDDVALQIPPAALELIGAFEMFLETA